MLSPYELAMVASSRSRPQQRGQASTSSPKARCMSAGLHLRWMFARNTAELRSDCGETRAAFKQIREVLARRDVDLAELRADWAKVHEAFRLSQEALAQKGHAARRAASGLGKTHEAFRLDGAR